MNIVIKMQLQWTTVVQFEILIECDPIVTMFEGDWICNWFLYKPKDFLRKMANNLYYRSILVLMTVKNNPPLLQGKEL